MKQFYLIILLFCIFIVSKAYNLRNQNELGNRIESNYSNVNVEEPNIENSEKSTENQIQSLKGIIQNLVKLNDNRLLIIRVLVY